MSLRSKSSNSLASGPLRVPVSTASVNIISPSSPRNVKAKDGIASKLATPLQFKKHHVVVVEDSPCITADILSTPPSKQMPGESCSSTPKIKSKVCFISPSPDPKKSAQKHQVSSRKPPLPNGISSPQLVTKSVTPSHNICLSNKSKISSQITASQLSANKAAKKRATATITPTPPVSRKPISSIPTSSSVSKVSSKPKSSSKVMTGQHQKPALVKSNQSLSLIQACDLEGSDDMHEYFSGLATPYSFIGASSMSTSFELQSVDDYQKNQFEISLSPVQQLMNQDISDTSALLHPIALSDSDPIPSQSSRYSQPQHTTTHIMRATSASNLKTNAWEEIQESVQTSISTSRLLNRILSDCEIDEFQEKLHHQQPTDEISNDESAVSDLDNVSKGNLLDCDLSTVEGNSSICNSPRSLLSNISWTQTSEGPYSSAQRLQSISFMRLSSSGLFQSFSVIPDDDLDMDRHRDRTLSMSNSITTSIIGVDEDAESDTTLDRGVLLDGFTAPYQLSSVTSVGASFEDSHGECTSGESFTFLNEP